MPRGDRTGPDGLGPMTGRAAGYCAGSNVPGYMNPAGGRMGANVRYGRGLAWRRGHGGGRGYGRGYFPPVQPAPYPPAPNTTITPQQEQEYLREDAKYLEQQLAQINKRLDELEKQEG